jgi:hypothetical protein
MLVQPRNNDCRDQEEKIETVMSFNIGRLATFRGLTRHSYEDSFMAVSGGFTAFDILSIPNGRAKGKITFMLLESPNLQS